MSDADRDVEAGTDEDRERHRLRNGMWWLTAASLVALVALVSWSILAASSGSGAGMIAASSGSVAVVLAWSSGYAAIKKRLDQLPPAAIPHREESAESA